MCFKGHFWWLSYLCERLSSPKLKSLHLDMSLGHLEVVENGQRWTSSIRQDLDDLSATGLPCSTFRVPEGVLADAAEFWGWTISQWKFHMKHQMRFWKIGLVLKFSWCLTIQVGIRIPQLWISLLRGALQGQSQWKTGTNECGLVKLEAGVGKNVGNREVLRCCLIMVPGVLVHEHWENPPVFVLEIMILNEKN